jgi:hypothetical protein
MIARVGPGMAAQGASRSPLNVVGGGLAAVVYQARAPPDLVTADSNYVLTKRARRGLRLWFREALFEGCGWPNDHHVAAGRSAICDPVDAKRSAAGTLQMRNWWGPQG